ncbi:hypothetical protein ZIOFF_039852 [Zingiber officinale]|uniref:Expansin-like EG45 domain-containing protein n=1 Tax=Zingiber officinale TaxID=94328 RepID=A0A8J5GD59_ZINOF|nr:hypothetical protein ZIOFF_039852 [Zingiber officinale]
MASSFAFSRSSHSTRLLLFFSCFLSFRSGESHPPFDLQWYPATATWYGSPDGDGSDGKLAIPGSYFLLRSSQPLDQDRVVEDALDRVWAAHVEFASGFAQLYFCRADCGACGYGTLVDVRPLRARVGAVSPVLFKDGEGCGACYKVRCLDRAVCSRRAATVIVTDECPGGYCASGRTHFDLSGAAFGHMAVAGEAGPLRDHGEIPVMFRRTACKYRGKNIAFHVNEGSTNYWLSLLVEFEDADGDIGSMHIRQVVKGEGNSVEALHESFSMIGVHPPMKLIAKTFWVAFHASLPASYLLLTGDFSFHYKNYLAPSYL